MCVWIVKQNTGCIDKQVHDIKSYWLKYKLDDFGAYIHTMFDVI